MKSGIGEFLSILRKSKGLTQQEVADALGVSNKTVSSWETGASCPDIGMLPAIAELFGVTCDELLRGERLPAAEPGARTEEKREKALARMLARLKNAAAISCWVSAGLYIVALVVTLLIGSAASESLIGFFVGLLFVLGGVFVNLIHYKSLRYQLTQDDFESAAVDDSLRALSVRQTVVLILAAAAFGFIVPHAFIPVHFGLRIGYAIGYGALGAVFAGLLAGGVYMIVRKAKRSYRTCRKKFFWTLKNGVIPYTAIAALAGILFLITAYSVSLRAPNGMVGVPVGSGYETYGQLQEDLQDSELFSLYEYTLYSTQAPESTVTQETLDARIDETLRCASWRCISAADGGAVYYFADFPREYEEAYDCTPDGNGAFVRVPVLSVTLKNGMVLSVPVFNREYQSGVLYLDENYYLSGGTTLYVLELTFGRPPYEAAAAHRAMVSVTVQIVVTAAIWLLIAAVYTAVYIPRRKKFLRALSSEQSAQETSATA